MSRNGFTNNPTEAATSRTGEAARRHWALHLWARLRNHFLRRTSHGGSSFSSVRFCRAVTEGSREAHDGVVTPLSSEGG